MTYESILLEYRQSVALITLNRPEALNALSEELVTELADALEQAEQNETVGAIVITGSDKAFAAGADIKQMQNKSYMDVYLGNFLSDQWEGVSRCRKPVLAAVAGYALGGGCELAMMCDFILAADNAKFGQPEIKLGTLPGLGGSQRLTRAVGKAKAMEMCLSGRNMDAAEAERAGLVSRVLPLAELLEETLKTAARIAAMSRPATFMVKEAVNKAFETTLAEGLNFERRLFHSSFASDDQKEGMAAFAEKRAPQFKNR